MSGFVQSGRFSSAFTPLSLSPALWLDASDTATITATGNIVTAWADKSTNGYNLTSVSGSPKTGLTSVNGLNVIDSTAAPTTQMYGASTNVLSWYAPDAKSHTTFMVFKSGSSVSAAWGICVGADERLSYDQRTATDAFYDAPYSGSNARIACTHTYITNTLGLRTFLRDGDAVQSIRINGSVEDTRAPSGVAATGTGFFELGSPVSGGTGTHGSWCEFIHYKSALSASDVLAVEAYLKTKWSTP